MHRRDDAWSLHRRRWLRRAYRVLPASSELGDRFIALDLMFYEARLLKYHPETGSAIDAFRDACKAADALYLALSAARFRIAHVRLVMCGLVIAALALLLARVF
jgi:hypothetical protein